MCKLASRWGREVFVRLELKLMVSTRPLPVEWNLERGPKIDVCQFSPFWKALDFQRAASELQGEGVSVFFLSFLGRCAIGDTWLVRAPTAARYWVACIC